MRRKEKKRKKTRVGCGVVKPRPFRRVCEGGRFLPTGRGRGGRKE